MLCFPSSALCLSIRRAAPPRPRVYCSTNSIIPFISNLHAEARPGRAASRHVTKFVLRAAERPPRPRGPLAVAANLI